MVDDSDSSGVPPEDQGTASETVIGPSPFAASDFSRRKRNRDIVRWSAISIFVLVSLLIAGRILWARTHTRPIINVNDTLAIQDSGRIDWDEMGLESPYRIARVGEGAVSTHGEYLEAIDGRSGPFIHLAAIDLEDESIERRFAYGDVSAYPEIELSDALEVVGSEDFTLEELGLPEGSRISAVEGEAIASVEEYSAIMAKDLGRLVRMTMEPPDGSGPPVDVMFHVLVWELSYTLYVVGVVFGALGLAVYWLRPDTRSSWGFMLFCLHVGLFWLMRSVPTEYRMIAERLPFFLLQCFLPLATIGLLMTFSPIRLVVRRPAIALWFGGGFGVFLIVVQAAVSGEYFWYFALAEIPFMMWALAMLALALVTLPIDFWFRLRKVELGSTDRARAKVIRLATLFGFVPTTLYTFYWMQTLGQSDSTRVLFDLSVLLFPLIIGYAIVRHNLLQIDELLHEAILYTLLLCGFGGAYAVVTGGAVPVVERIVPGSAGMLQPVLMAGIAVVALPVHQRLRTRLAVRFRRLSPDTDALDELVDEVAQSVTTSEEFSERTVDKLGEAIGATSIVLLLRHPSRQEWSVGGDSSKVLPADWRRACQPILNKLENRHRRVSRDLILDQVSADESRWELLGALSTLRANVVFPLVAQGRLVGGLAVGDKRNARNYSQEDLGALRRFARQSALVISKLLTHQVAARGARIVDVYPDYPERIGDYEILDFIGEGGMSYVYRGRKDGREVAIKVANHVVQSDATLRERFQREAKAMEHLDHPNVVRIFEVGSHGDEPFIAIEFFVDGSLDDHLKRTHEIGEREAIEFITQTARGLEAGFEQGIVHRDIKPKNLFLGSRGTVKIGDFGLVHLSSDATITQSGQIFGTPQYMGPEIFRGERAVRATDEYALGVTLYEILAGSRPYVGDTMEALIHAHLNAPVPDVRRARKGISQETSQIIRRMMAKTPDERFGSYSELISALEKAAPQG